MVKANKSIGAEKRAYCSSCFVIRQQKELYAHVCGENRKGLSLSQAPAKASQWSISRAEGRRNNKRGSFKDFVPFLMYLGHLRLSSLPSIPEEVFLLLPSREGRAEGGRHVQMMIGGPRACEGSRHTHRDHEEEEEAERRESRPGGGGQKKAAICRM